MLLSLSHGFCSPVSGICRIHFPHAISPDEPSNVRRVKVRFAKARLKNRVNELAAKAEKPILLQIEVKNIIERMHLSLALPNELESLDAEP